MSFAMHDPAADLDGDMMNEINMTPLVDVMLVLLIIFIITVPVMKHALHIELPRATTQPQPVKPDVNQLSIDAQGAYFWNQKPITLEALEPQLRIEAEKAPQPELHIRGDKAARYEFVMAVMAQARNAGLKKIAFLSEPLGNRR
jgi:biopolymer transport protein ExbD